MVSGTLLAPEERPSTGVALIERQQEVGRNLARVTATVDSSDNAATLAPSLRVHHVDDSMFFDSS